MLERADQGIGRIELLDRLNLAADTLVIFTSDNGTIGRMNAVLQPLRASLPR
jgi:arylsulfatase A-like enzyme